jgi:hypothetical protein
MSWVSVSAGEGSELGWCERDQDFLATVTTGADRQLISTTTPDAGAHRDPDHGELQILPVLSAAEQTVLEWTR